MESPKAGIVLKENPLYDNFDSASSKSKKEAHPDVMSVMMADITVEAAMAEMERKVNFLMKVVEERDYEIIALREQMRTHETTDSIQQLQDMIANSIRAQYGGPPQTSFMYSKLYTKRIDNLRMPLGYQPLKFQQFDGKDNPKQHIAHFVETCENAGLRGDQLVRQFIRSLKGNAFECTRRTVSMMELTNTKQWKGEPVIDYINRWRALSLDCEDRLTKLSAVEMCTQGMHWVLLHILQGIKPRTFEELATRAHDMELSIADRGTKNFPVLEVRKDKKETKSAEKVVKSTVKESMVVNTTALKFSKRKEGRAKKKDDGSERQCSTLKERQKKVYPFPDSDIADMLEQLLEKQLIQLSKCKRPEQAGKVNDPNYCKYHRVISHPVEKCFVLKELILRLTRKKKKIELDLEEDENPGVVACHAINETEEESIPLRSLEEEELSKDLSKFNVDDLLSLPQETKTILINALLNSAALSSSAPTATYESTPYCMSIDFSDEDLLLGSKLHNRPLYVSGYVREQRVDQILIDNGSAINIMPKSTMRQLGILMDELSNSKLVIQDSRTTYKLLLGRPWIHGNRVVTSTLHQCFKFYQDGVKKVEADPNPFSEAESHFADAKFYLKNDNSPKVVYIEVPLVNAEDNLQLKSLASREPYKSTGTFHSRKGEASTSTTKSMILMDEKTSNPLILRYIPLSRHKKVESPFVKSPQGLKVGDIEVLKESLTTPLTKITKQELKIDLTEASLSQRRTKDGFDPKAYKLMTKAGYDFITHTEFKSLKIHEQPKLSSTKKKLLREGHVIPMSRKGLGYKSPEPIRITRKGKEKVVDNNHITVEEVDSMKEKEGDSQRISAFDRISPHVARAQYLKD
ncbi:ty3-gypsy retrotransposon protein [Cucumis melo var. makuwa]|uniref:Ty3-gypsy retrotransposon protein n=1 Tax=Cucumis melo var. makuwa TaxID=1194695 RepID=A0A5D3DR73_CUCMM|nr:ty3-gypsy retrotransposon protein [Cucumis melo var. makuwa]